MSTTPTDPLAWWQQMMQQAAPIPGLTLPTLDVDEIDRRIREYQAVEGWLQMNLASIQTMRKTLEMQRAALTTWNQFQSQMQQAAAAPAKADDRSAGNPATASADAAGGALPNPFQWLQNLWQATQQAVQASATATHEALGQAGHPSTAADTTSETVRSKTAAKRAPRRRSAGENPEKP